MKRKTTIHVDGKSFERKIEFGNRKKRTVHKNKKKYNRQKSNDDPSS